jgi:maltose O-acetyltransferase
MKNLLKRVLYPHSYSSDAYIKYLRSKHIRIGEGCYIFSPNHVSIDTERPHMLHIGDYCKITSGVKIMTHDYSRSVLCNLDYGNVGEAGKTVIGNNCFLGLNALILMGTKIGDNCIVGAGSVCCGTYPSNSVIAGNPAKVICTLEDFHKKRKANEVTVAKEYVKEFRTTFGKDPSVEEMTNSFMWLYLPRNKESLEKYKELFKHNGVDEKIFIDNFMKSEPPYESFESFLKDCK